MAVFLSHDLGAAVNRKWMLWDTSAIIRVVDCEAEDVFVKFQELGVVENVTIKPVVLELGATTDQKVAAKRADYLDRFITTTLKVNLDGPNDKTLNIQQALPASSQPGAVDLMLASTLSQYSDRGSMLFLTENIKDFPEPLFRKSGFVMVSNTGRSFGLTILSMDVSRL